MSLRVWLPLNGNLENKGISNVTIVSGNPSYKAGKIGLQALNLNNRITFDCSALANLQTFSICFWGMAETSSTLTTNWQDLLGFTDVSSGGSNGTFRWETTYGFTSSKGIHWHDNATNALVNGAHNHNEEKNTWVHCCVVFNNEEGKIYSYDNGILTQTHTHAGGHFNSTGRFYLGETNNIEGRITDVRIYDHALSAAEIKEISQGLILHYKLNSAYSESSQNLCTAVRPGTGANITWGGHVTQWTNYDATNDPVPFNEGTKGEIVYGSNGSTGGGASRSICRIAAYPSTAYTYSCYIKASDNLAYTHANFLYKYEYTAASGGTTITEAGYFNNARKELLNNGWYRIWGTFTTRDTTNGINISFYTYPGKNVTYWLGGWQIEQKDHVTPFMSPGASRNDTIIQDSSGYGHNGTINGTLMLSNDTPRYSSSTIFNGTNTKIQVPNLTPDAITISFWMKRNANTGNRQFMYTAWSGVTCELTGNGTPTFAVNRSNYPTITGTPITTSSGWIHYCGTFDITNGLRLYQNGILQASNNALTPISWSITTNYIGYYNTYYNGLMSDFRIYCTALSASDIKQLYEVGAKIDNKQNLHTFEIIETNNNLLAGKVWTNNYGNHSSSSYLFTNFNNSGEYQFTANSTSAGSEYITINPTGHTYEYDYTISVNAGNQFYIGFERYDINKTSRPNQACVYTTNIKPSSDIVKQRCTGTVNLSTDGTNPCAFIALRILNGWSGTTSGVTGMATIHNFSLREISTKHNPSITKKGQCIEEEIIEGYNMKLHKSGIVETTEIIEF